MIEVHRVSKRFGRLEVLRDIELRIGAGDRVAFVGSNGSGKTTLLRAILGLVHVQGSITIDGFDVSRDPVHALRRVAYIPQIAPPLDAPVREVVLASARLRGFPEERVSERAARLGLSLTACESHRFRDLSGGQKQKLLAAMALASEADVVICDEPTANLDAAARDAFFAQMNERGEGRTVILCSHRVDEVKRLVSRVVELSEGRICRDVVAREPTSRGSRSGVSSMPPREDLRITRRERAS
ncbi:MAG TPA: ABC transporter ATP-binding protein [Polyangiaceae bacterium]|nr:ABC transporter ATP-binding protein [Polyangiaceae bacterium]